MPAAHGQTHLFEASPSWGPYKHSWLMSAGVAAPPADTGQNRNLSMLCSPTCSSLLSQGAPRAAGSSKAYSRKGLKTCPSPSVFSTHAQLRMIQADPCDERCGILLLTSCTRPTSPRPQNTTDAGTRSWERLGGEVLEVPLMAERHLSKVCNVLGPGTREKTTKGPNFRRQGHPSFVHQSQGHSDTHKDQALLGGKRG